MIRAIIIDDEQHCIDRLSGLITEYLAGQVHIMSSFTSLEDGENAIRKYKPDLVFLDVQLDAGKTAFDMLPRLKGAGFEIIFTTAYESYAVKAFKFCALDYLLKPIDQDNLNNAIQKLLNKTSEAAITEKLGVLLENAQSIKKRICVSVITGLEVLKLDDMVRCESDINYTTIYLKDNKKLKVAKVLKEFEEMLSDFNFFRVHKSHLINLDYVKSYRKGNGGTVIMTDGTKIEVAMRRKEDFLKRLSKC